LISFVARDEPEFIVEPVRVGACLVRGELHQCAPPFPALPDCPFQHALSRPCAAVIFINPDGLYLTAPCTFAGNAGNECDLQRADHVFAIACDSKELIAICPYRLEHSQVFPGQWQPGLFAQVPRFIIREKRNYGWQIPDDGATEHCVRAGHARIRFEQEFRLYVSTDPATYFGTSDEAFPVAHRVHVANVNANLHGMKPVALPRPLTEKDDPVPFDCPARDGF